MNTPFFQLLSQTLSNQADIEDLPTHKLIALHTFHPKQVNIFHQLENSQYKLLMRLQTLFLMESQKLTQPRFEDTALAAKATEASFATTAIEGLHTLKQTSLRLQMLNWLIAEAMHSFVPSECDHFDCSYRISPNGRGSVKMYRVPVD